MGAAKGMKPSATQYAYTSLFFALNRQRGGSEIPSQTIPWAYLRDHSFQFPTEKGTPYLVFLHKQEYFFFLSDNVFVHPAIRYHFRKEAKLSVYLSLHLLWDLTHRWITLVRSLICSTPTVYLYCQ